MTKEKTDPNVHPELKLIDKEIDAGVKHKKITTTLEIETYRRIIEKRLQQGGGYAYNELIGLGLLAREQNPQLIKRIRNSEVTQVYIERKLEILQKELGNSIPKIIKLLELINAKT